MTKIPVREVDYHGQTSRVEALWVTPFYPGAEGRLAKCVHLGARSRIEGVDDAYAVFSRNEEGHWHQITPALNEREFTSYYAHRTALASLSPGMDAWLDEVTEALTRRPVDHPHWLVGYWLQGEFGHWNHRVEAFADEATAKARVEDLRGHGYQSAVAASAWLPEIEPYVRRPVVTGPGLSQKEHRTLSRWLADTAQMTAVPQAPAGKPDFNRELAFGRYMNVSTYDLVMAYQARVRGLSRYR